MSEPITPNDIQLASVFEKENPQFFPNPTSRAHQLRNRDSNGLKAAGAVLLFNGHLYINIPKYLSVMTSKVA